MKTLKRLLMNLLVMLDEVGNTLTGGSPNETISSRAGKAQLAGQRWGCVLCGLLDKIQKNHCQIAMSVYIGEDAVIPDAKD
jgi:hypothetical protein